METPPTPVPERRSARLLVVDADGRLLLVRYDDGREPPFWATPGGQLLAGESFEQAAARELAEETGLAAPVGPCVRTREAVLTAGDVGPARWVERYFVVRAAAAVPERAGWTAEERQTIRATRWWSLAELRATDAPLLPGWLPDALAAVLEERGPPAG